MAAGACVVGTLVSGLFGAAPSTRNAHLRETTPLFYQIPDL